MIQLLETYRGRMTNEAAIAPGLYEDADPRLFGLADYMVANGYALRLSHKDASPQAPAATGDTVYVQTLSHQEFVDATGRGATTGSTSEINVDPTNLTVEPATSPSVVDYSTWTPEELRAECAQRGINLDEIKGSGANGRLLKDDLIAILKGDDTDNVANLVQA